MTIRAYRRCRRVLASVSSALLLVGFMVWSVAAAPVAAAAPPVINIGVDNATPAPCASAPTGTKPPACHNFEYTHFFPNGLSATITVHPGDVVNFAENQQSPDGFHTATLLKSSETGLAGQAAAFTEFPLSVTDTDTGDAPGQQQINPAVFFPSNPACGNSASNACPYDGTADINSGALFAGGNPGLFTQINVPTGTVVPFVCLIHFGMRGQLLVQDPPVTATTQADLDAKAASDYAAETADALAQETALNTAPPHTANANGTTNWLMTAGTDGAGTGGAASDPAVQVLEMLPSTLSISPGDTVTWHTTTTREIHNITFPRSQGLIAANPAYNAFPFACEGPGGDTSPTFPPAPPNLGCPGPPSSGTGFETHGNFAPAGPTTIATPVTLVNSGVIDNIPALGGVSTTAAYSFPNQNSFNYQCTVHDNMRGVVNVVGTPGYRELATDGGVFAFGSSGFFGSTGNMKLNKPIVGGAATPTGKGYWAVATDGGVFAFGDAGFFGSTGSIKLNKPIVGMTPTPDGGGYFLFASDGGVFAFGNAAFAGSAGSITLNKPVVAGAVTPDGLGYTLVASDGGIFTYGDAEFHGSAGAIKLNKPVVGMAPTPSGGGYFLVATDGGIFTYGDAAFFGSTGAIKLNKPVVGMGATIDGLGYTLVASDGGVFNYGDSVFAGSQGGSPLNSPIVSLLR